MFVSPKVVVSTDKSLLAVFVQEPPGGSFLPVNAAAVNVADPILLRKLLLQTLKLFVHFPQRIFSLQQLVQPILRGLSAIAIGAARRHGAQGGAFHGDAYQFINGKL